MSFSGFDLRVGVEYILRNGKNVILRISDEPDFTEYLIADIDTTSDFGGIYFYDPKMESGNFAIPELGENPYDIVGFKEN
jgi:hypothetical protein